MSFMYEGVNVDVVAPGYPSTSASTTRANNIITIATRKLAEIEGIVASYQAAYTPYAAALAYAKTLDPRSKDPSVRNAIIAAQIQISKLNPELAKWGKIVVANGGKFSSGTAGNTGSSLDATPDFTAKRKKYNDDIAKYNKDLVNNVGPIICAPYDAAYAAMLNQARADNATALTRAETAANTQAGLSNRLNAILDPNQNSNSPGYTEGRNPSTVNGILGGLQDSLDWNATTLLLAFDNTPNSNLYNRPTSAQLASLLRSRRIKNGTPLKQVQSALLGFGRKRKR